MPAPADAAVHTTIDAQGIATLTIRGAKSMNIIGTSHIVAATEAMNQLATDPAVRVLVLRGPDDRAFVGGADINEMAALTPATAEVSCDSTPLAGVARCPDTQSLAITSAMAMPPPGADIVVLSS